MGLGLVVCKFLAPTIEGEVFITSNHEENAGEETGTKVKVVFPCILVKNERKKQEEEGEGEEEINTAMVRIIEDGKDHEEIMEGKNIRILCIDDSPLIAKYIIFFMKMLEFTNVIVTTSWVEGLEILASYSVDLLITDFKLSAHVNAIQLLQRINDLKEKPKSVIIFSGTDESSVRKQCEDEGVFFDGFVPKPIGLLTLRSCIENYVDF